MGCLLKNAKYCSAAIRLALEHATVLAPTRTRTPSASISLRLPAACCKLSARLIGCGLIKSEGDRPPTNWQLV